MAKTVVALFDDMNHAQMAVRELQDGGFRREDISLVASDATREGMRSEGTGDTGEAVATGAIGGAGIGAALGGVAGLLVGLGALTIPGIGPIVAAGPIAAALAGAGMGAVAGGLVGALVGLGVPEDEAGYYAEGVRRGGTLVTVQTSDEMANRAADALNRHHPVNIKQRASSWRESGWRGFDPDAKLYRPGEREYERTRGTYGTGMTADTTGMSDLDREQARYGERHDTDPNLVTGMGGADHARTDYERTDYGRGTYESGTGLSGNVGDFDLYEPNFRRHYDTRFATTGYGYDRYRPAYMYGYTLHRQSDCNGDCMWEDYEAQARRDWERSNPDNAWEDFKDAIREGWDALTHGR